MCLLETLINKYGNQVLKEGWWKNGFVCNLRIKMLILTVVCAIFVEKQPKATEKDMWMQAGAGTWCKLKYKTMYITYY